jgi:hypothetical protein
MAIRLGRAEIFLALPPDAFGLVNVFNGQTRFDMFRINTAAGSAVGA